MSLLRQMKTGRSLNFLPIVLAVFLVGLIVGGCSSKEGKESAAAKTPVKSKPAPQEAPRPKEKLPLFSARRKIPGKPSKPTKTPPREPKPEGQAKVKTPSEPSPAASVGKETAVKTASLPPESPPESRLNPLEYYDFEVTDEKYEPYSPLATDKITVSWRVINSVVKTEAENLRQANIVLSQMKRKHPDAYLYVMNINGTDYIVDAKIGKIIPTMVR